MENLKNNTCLLRDEQALAHNIREIRQYTNKKIIAVIKREGYGTGLLWEYEQCRRAGINFFAVSTASEARRLRQAGCRGEILLLTPAESLADCISLIRHNVIFMLGSRRQAELLCMAGKYVSGQPRIHLKIDTGLGRYGFTVQELQKTGWIEEILQGLCLEGCYTHLALQGTHFLKDLKKQKARFDLALKILKEKNISPGMTHVAASKAFAACGDLGYDGIRVGSLLLGQPETKTAGNYLPVCRLQTPLCEISLREKGSSTGYDASFRLKRNAIVGMVHTGYADGVFLSPRSPVGNRFRTFLSRLYHIRKGDYMTAIAGGKRVPVLGKPGTEFILLDLTDVPLSAGASVILPVNPLYLSPQIPRSSLSTPDIEQLCI